MVLIKQLTKHCSEGFTVRRNENTFFSVVMNKNVSCFQLEKAKPGMEQSNKFPLMNKTYKPYQNTQF